MKRIAFLLVVIAAVGDAHAGRLWVPSHPAFSLMESSHRGRIGNGS